MNLFDSKARFLQGRDAQGNWRLDSSKYDPRVWGSDAEETTARDRLQPHQQLTGASPTCTAAGAGWPGTTTRTSPARDGLAELVGSYSGVIHEMTEAHGRTDGHLRALQRAAPAA